MGIAVEPRSIRFIGRPLEIAWVVTRDQDGPLRWREMADPLLDLSLRVNIPLTSSFAIAVGARLDGMGEDVVDRRVRRRGPANRISLVTAQGQGQALGMKPEPDPARGTQFNKPFEHRANGGDYRGIGVEAHLAVLLAPAKADGHASPPFAAGGLVADTAVEPRAADGTRLRSWFASAPARGAR